MTPFDRQVRAQVYRHLVASGVGPNAQQLADARGWPTEEVEESLARLETEHLVALVPGEPRIRMAHPFSGVETGSKATIGPRSWPANCAWDALAILSLLGDGTATTSGPQGKLTWTVEEGVVSPDGVIHLEVPAARFWDDIEHT